MFWGIGKAFRRKYGKTFRQALGMQTPEQVAQEDKDKGRLTDHEKSVYDELLPVIEKYEKTLKDLLSQKNKNNERYIEIQLQAHKNAMFGGMSVVTRQKVGMESLDFINSTKDRATKSGVNVPAKLDEVLEIGGSYNSNFFKFSS